MSSKRQRQNQSNRNQNEVRSNKIFERLLNRSGLNYNTQMACFESQNIHFAPLFRSQFLHLGIDTNPTLLSQFLSALEEIIDSHEVFVALLSPVESPQSSNSTPQSYTLMNLSTSESICRALLSIDSIQPQIASLILTTIIADPEATCGKRGRNDSASDRSLTILILSQFRWLERIVDDEAFMEQILAILDTASTTLKSEIISLLPEIFDDRGHRTLAKHLMDLLQEERSLTATVLEALSNMVLPSEMLESIRNDTVMTLSSVKSHDIPIVVKFLLQTSPVDDLQQTVRTIRENLDLSTLLVPQEASLSTSLIPQDTSNDVGVLLVDTFRWGIRQNPHLGKALLRELEQPRTGTTYHILDIWLILSLASLDQTRKAAEALLKRKLISGNISQKVVAKSFSDICGPALQQFFPILISLASKFLPQTTHSIRTFASVTFERGFLIFADDFHRQEILRTLLLHFGSGTKSEISASLDVFFRLAESAGALLLRYQVFFQGLLDHNANLSQDQVEKVYILLCTLAFHRANTESGLADSIRMMIQKQLSSTSMILKRVGIIGHVQLIKFLLSHDSDTLPAYVQSIDVMDLIKRCLDSTRMSSPLCMAFFLQELGYLLFPPPLFQDPDRLTLPRNIAVELDILADDEFGPFLGVVESLTDTQRSNLQFDLSPMATTDQLVSSVAILFDRFYDTTMSYLSLPRGEKVLRLGALLRFFALIEIDGEKTIPPSLLSCGIVLPANIQQDLEQGTLPDQLSPTLFFQVFFLINWFREIINAFAWTDDDERQTIVVLRLQHLVMLEHLFEYGLQSLSIQLPLLHPYLPPFTTSKPRGGATMQELKNAATPLLDKIQPYFYPFDFTLFAILGYATADSRPISLEPYVFQYLLDELNRKLSYCVKVAWRDEKKPIFFTANQDQKYSPLAQQRTPSSPDAILAFLATEVIPGILNHLERNSQLLVALASSSESSLSAERGVCPESFRRALECCSLPLKLKVEMKEENLKYYIAALSKMVPLHGQTVEAQAQIYQMPIHDLVRSCFAYWEQHRALIHDLPTMTALLQLLDTVLTRFACSELAISLSEIAAACLRRQWDCSTSQGKLPNKELGIILELMLRYSAKPREQVHFFCSKVVPAWVRHAADPRELIPPQLHFPTLDVHTLAVYYKVLLHAVGSEGKLLQSLVKKSVQTLGIPTVLQRISEVVSLFKLCLALTVSQPKQQIISIALRESRRFLDFFYEVMPFLSTAFEQYFTAAARILHQFEDPISILQSICLQTKEVQDATSWKYIPLLTKAVDKFVYRTKEIFATQGHSESLRFGTRAVKPLVKLQSVQGRSHRSHPNQHSRSEPQSSNESEPERIPINSDDEEYNEEEDNEEDEEDEEGEEEDENDS